MLGFAPSLRLGAGLSTQVGPEVTEPVLAAPARGSSLDVARHASANQVDVTVDVDSAGMLTVLVTDVRMRQPRPKAAPTADGCVAWPGAPRSWAAAPGSRASRARRAGPGPGTRLEWRVPAD